MTRHVRAMALVLVLCPSVMAARADDAVPEVHDGDSGPARAWAAAMEAGDLAALARLHGPATVTFPPGQTQVVGAEAIMAGYRELFASFTVRIHTDDTHWIESGPLVVSWGLTTLTLHPKAGGADVVNHTRFTDAALRVDGGWRYVVDHASVPKTK